MVKKWDVTIPALTGKKKRKAYIWLPDSYREDPERRYPVLYMFDGHNVFFDSDATYGTSWGMYDYMVKSDKQLIIVAVECNHQGNRRLREYSPFNFNNELGSIRGQGKVYMDWLVNELKPQIDKDYRTLPDRDNTLICGSSMGGLMSLYAVTRYNHVFRRAACLSPSLWVDPEKIIRLIKKADIKNDTVVYMDYGSMELANHAATVSALADISNLLLLEKRVDLTTRVVPDGYHSEACWRKQVPVFMECLGVE